MWPATKPSRLRWVVSLTSALMIGVVGILMSTPANATPSTTVTRATAHHAEPTVLPMSPLATKPAKPAPQRTNASAATGCYNFSCTGQDPQAMGCSADGQTIDELTYNGVRYELRLSNNCYAAWTRVTSPGWSNFDFGQIRGGDADFYAIYGVQVDTGQVWTKMIAFHYWVQACQSGWFDGAPNACTASH